MIYEAYGWLHLTAKKVLGKSKKEKFKMVDLSADLNVQNERETWFNDIQLQRGTNRLLTLQAFPVENIVEENVLPELKLSFQGKGHKHKKGIAETVAIKKWKCFIEKSKIPDNYRNGGLCYAGYIADCESWCLPSWIWTNAAIVRVLCKEDLPQAKKMADKLLSLQCECGGWIVRNDYSESGMIPMLAPNDSAYLANNAMLSVYKRTKERQYLESAEKCADWIMKTARNDGLVWVGMNARTGQWIRKNNIVDIGFTAGLFAELYVLTEKECYKSYLKKFTSAYMKLFRKADGSFATGLNEKDEQIGGAFGRGQAWALEGLIPAYQVLKTDELKNSIEAIIKNLLKKQIASGGWPYNLDRTLLGVDCKATSVIGTSLIKWYPYSSDKENIKKAVRSAICWCLKNTVNDESEASGGIFSYCMEGAIVHHLYTSTAFVYSSAYAIEMLTMAKNMESVNDIFE